MALRIQADRERFVELHEKGKPVQQIASQMFVSRNTVYNILRASGVVFDPRRAGKKKEEAISS